MAAAGSALADTRASPDPASAAYSKASAGESYFLSLLDVRTAQWTHGLLSTPTQQSQRNAALLPTRFQGLVGR